MRYLFRGQILEDVEERGDVSVGKKVWFKDENSSKTYNFKKFAKELDEEDNQLVEKIDSNESYYEAVSKLKEKYHG